MYRISNKSNDKIEIIDEENNYFKIEKEQIERLDNYNNSLMKLPITNKIQKVKNIIDSTSAKKEFIRPMYIIPRYQRGYRWYTEQVKNLLDDVYKNYKKYYKELNNEKQNLKTGYEYCLQPLVVAEVKETISKYEVIDGQQRLTTIALILAALEELSPNNGSIPDRILLQYESRSDIANFISNISNRCREELKKCSTYQEAIKNDELLKLAIDIDSKFILNTYLFVYYYFKDILEEETFKESYFGFLNDENDLTEDYSPKRLDKLKKMFIEYTTVIWYEPKSIDEHKVFENFNSGKIPLTKSELIKALFMNPDNYILEGAEDWNEEAIKTRQIMLGAAWDEIEKKLHNEEFWFFVPHHSTWHEQTRIDAIFDLYVYEQCCKRDEKFNFDDNIFSFRKLEEWINAELKNANTSSNKALIMHKCWDEISSVYNTLEEWYSANTYLIETSKYSLFHRISLYQYMADLHFDKITRGNQIEKYENRLKTYNELRNNIENACKNGQVIVMNKLLVKFIDRFWNNKSTKVIEDEIKYRTELPIEKKIKALDFDSSNLLINVFLIIFNLATLEQTKSLNARFSFYEFSKEDWIKEHIFAKGTTVSSKNDAIEMLRQLTNCDMNEYLDFKFEGLLSDEKIDKIKNVKNGYLNTLKPYIDGNQLPEDIKEKIFKPTDNNYMADTEDFINENTFDSLYVEYLKDNSMGNMALLTRSDNSTVSNKDFIKKRQKVIEKVSKGSFVPIGTTNVFYGVYNDESNLNSNMWLPCHRKKYLESLIKLIKDYLGEEK